MNINLPYELRQLPAHQFNQVAILFINSIALYLLTVVCRNSGLKAVKCKIFLMMAISMLVWVNFAYVARLFGLYPEISTSMLHVAWLATPFVFYSSYLISIYIIEKVEENRKISIVLLFLTLLVSFSAGFTDLVIKGVKFTDGTLDIIYGNGFFPFLFSVLIIMVFTLIPLIKARSLTDSTKVFLIGIVVFYIANLVFNISLPVFFNVTRLYFFGDYSTIFLLALTTYSITRYALFDVKIITTEVVTVILWIVLLVRMFISQSFSQTVIDSSIFLIAVIFGFLLIRSVINEVKHREQLQILNNKLKELDKQKDEFVSMAAHELRSPLTAIKGYLSMVIEGDAGDIPEKARQYLADSKAVTDRLVRLVNNMLNVTRIEEGRIVYQLEETSLIRAVQEIFNSSRVEAERKKLEFKISIPNGLDDNVKVDPDRVREVVGNIVSNAIKFTEKGSISITMTNPKPEIVRIEVSDTGPGISKEEQSKLFQKFYRAESTAGKTFGTGLGLYITRLLVENFGGRMGVISEIDKGSNFWFELPVVKRV